MMCQCDQYGPVIRIEETDTASPHSGPEGTSGKTATEELISKVHGILANPHLQPPAQHDAGVAYGVEGFTMLHA